MFLLVLHLICLRTAASMTWIKYAPFLFVRPFLGFLGLASSRCFRDITTQVLDPDHHHHSLPTITFMMATSDLPPCIASNIYNMVARELRYIHHDIGNNM